MEAGDDYFVNLFTPLDKTQPATPKKLDALKLTKLKMSNGLLDHYSKLSEIGMNVRDRSGSDQFILCKNNLFLFLHLTKNVFVNTPTVHVSAVEHSVHHDTSATGA